MWLFGSRVDRQAIIDQGNNALGLFKARRQEMEKIKDDRLKRQAELWAIFNLDDDLQAEYRQVSGQVALLAKQLVALSEHIGRLEISLSRCQRDKDCPPVQELLKISDPCAGITADTEPVTLPK